MHTSVPAARGPGTLPHNPGTLPHNKETLS
jgi:hypothetical protein